MTYEQFLLSAKPEEKVLDVDGVEITLNIRPLSWSAKNKIVSQAVNIVQEADGSQRQSFDGDFYLRECLKHMITHAPWGNTTDLFLTQIDDRLGKALESLVPLAFDATGDDPAETKKGSKTTSTAKGERAVRKKK